MIRINIPLHESGAKVQYKNEILYTSSKKYFSVKTRLSSAFRYFFFDICHTNVKRFRPLNCKFVTISIFLGMEKAISV